MTYPVFVNISAVIRITAKFINAAHNIFKDLKYLSSESGILNPTNHVGESDNIKNNNFSSPPRVKQMEINTGLNPNDAKNITGRTPIQRKKDLSIRDRENDIWRWKVEHRKQLMAPQELAGVIEAFRKVLNIRLATPGQGKSGITRSARPPALIPVFPCAPLQIRGESGMRFPDGKPLWL